MPELAVFSPGTISHRFMEGMKDVRGARVTAFITRNPENCRKYAAEYGISTVGTFEEVIRTRRIEGVYISSPTFLHADHIRLCLEHDLHVLCEKPVTVKREEYEILLSLAHQRGLVFMEAQKALYLPAFLEIRSLLEANALGTVHTVRAGFCRNEHLEENAWRRTMPGRGALYDVGCYPLAAIFGLFGTDCEELERKEITEGDLITGGSIRFRKGETDLIAEYSMTEDGFCGLQIHGETGSISCPSFWKADHYELTRNGEKEEIRFIYGSEFAFETQIFIDRIQTRSVTDSWSEEISLRILKTIDR